MNLVDIFILLTGISAIVYSGYLTRKFKNDKSYFIPVMVWAVHLTLFYTLVITADLMRTTLDEMFKVDDLFATWSTWQRFHGVTTMLFMMKMVSNQCSKHR